MSPSPRRILALALAALAMAACAESRAPERLGRVIHLDPRLPDGRSPALALEAQRSVVAEWDFDSLEAWPTEWSHDGVLMAARGPHGGLQLRPPSRGSSSLSFTGDLDPDQVNGIEIDVALSSSARATATWFRLRPQPGGFVADLIEPVPSVQTLHFDLAGHKAWRGAIERLVLQPSSNRTQVFELLAIRFLHVPFAWGASPIDATGVTSGDGGLVDRGGLAVRAWPASLGEQLVERVLVPPGGRLSVQVARSSISSPVELVGRVVVGTGETAVSAEVALSLDDATWHPLLLDLDSLVGQEVELRFTAEAAGGASGAPRADVLFGAPLVFGDLPEDRLPNILLVTLDTLRFDALGSSLAAAAKNGETEPRPDRVRTPALDRFAASSFVFENAWSAGNSTQPSHASILTGVSIQNHSLLDNYGVLTDANVTLAERLRDAGYETAAVTCQRAISPAAGFGQGFDVFVPAEAVSSADGRLAIDDAIEWLERWSEEGDRPFFLWVHVFDPHTPYELPGSSLATYAEAAGPPPAKRVLPPTLPVVDKLPPELEFLGKVNSRDHVNYLYHAEVAYTDHLMDELLSALDQTGVAEHTLSLITADHGEFLGERGNFFNHRGLFPETLHVPLLLKLPGQKEGRRIPDRVTNRDFVPTVLSALGLIDPAGPRDLVEVATSGGDPTRRLWFEHANGLQVGCRDAQYHFFTVLRDGYAFGMHSVDGPDGPRALPEPYPKGSVFIYDWTKDPGLTHNLADEDPELVKRYLGLLAEYRASARPVAREARAVGAEEEAELEALGYTGD